MHIIFNTIIICNSSGTNDGNKTCVKQLRLKYDDTCNSEKLMHHDKKTYVMYAYLPFFKD